MFRKKEAESKNDSLIFMNTPISSEAEDVIGFSTHVEKLDAAISNGGQMIALTSPFGSGKTSIIELLQGKYNTDSQKQILKISMWSHLCSNIEKTEGANDSEEPTSEVAATSTIGETTELHRGFVYQLISQINRRKGIYVSKFLNQNYGLLKLQTEKFRYWIYTLISISLFLFGYILPQKFEISLSILGEKAAQYESLMLIFSVLFFLLVITRAEIVFSSNKSEGGRKIDTNEIMQLYRTEVLQYKCKINFLEKIIYPRKKTRHYIVVIEDLDRTDDGLAVINFLKELRKYYVPEIASGQGSHYRNKVTFLINVKPETQLCSKEREQEEYGHLYAKLFDYVLNLQTINIDDYETILEGLLKQKEGAIRAIGINWNGEMLDIPGIRWVIRGSHLGIREIKDRLNIAFSLFESLKEKFEKGITFEKCAIVAYVITEFEESFYATDDHAFQKLVELHLQRKLDDKTAAELLPTANTNYTNAIRELIQSKLIDSNYRMYFYNYPKDSRIFSVDEASVQKAILYGESTETLDDSISTVLSSESTIIAEAFQTRKQLGLQLPGIVFESENLYIEALKHAFPEIIAWLKSLDYSSDSCDKTIEQIREILHFDSTRSVYSRTHAYSFVKEWERNFTETSLLQLRRLLCKEFSGEILWYTPLFFGIHKMISNEELSTLSLIDAFKLINVDSDNFSDDTVAYITNRFAQEPDVQHLSDSMQAFLKNAGNKLGDNMILFDYLAFMAKNQQIVPEFESAIFNALNTDSTEEKKQLFKEYQQIINHTADAGLSEQTLQYISRCKKYDGYSPTVTLQMDRDEYLFDFILQSLHQGSHIPFEREDIISTIQDNITWLISEEQYFFSIRKLVVKENLDVLRRYNFMFSVDCPIMTKDELQILYFSPASESDVISMVPATLFTSNEIKIFKPYFCRTKQSSPVSFEILTFISKMTPDVAKEMFYSLNFDMVRYRYMSNDRKKATKEAFHDILSLDTAEGKLQFMAATKQLDSPWETDLLDDLKSDKNLQAQYIKAVKNSDPNKPITKTTVQTLCSLGTIYPMEERVYQRYFDFKYYQNYVACKTISRASFELESGEKGDLLWPIYLDIFGHTEQNAYKGTKKHMGENRTFLEKIMKEKAYVGINQESLLYLASIHQSKDCIVYIFSLENEFALEYLTQIEGFENESAATAFVEEIEKNTNLLKSDELYEHTHSKLVSGLLKAKYTRARTKNGFGKEN